ncbi:MAG: LamG-like jellyroll fold domain-containing protein [Bacteroidota bacterium]
MKSTHTLFQLILSGLLLSFCANLPAQNTLDAGLLAYYPFNTNALDESGNGHDGVVNGAALTSDRFGKPNAAFLFDGIDDYIQLDEYQDTLENFSVCAWVKINEFDNLNDDFAQVFRTPYLALGRNDQKVAVYAFGVNNDNGDPYYRSNGTVDTSGWIFLASTYEKVTGQYKIYIDGVIDISYSNKFGTPLSQLFTIGGEPTFRDGRFFSGKIDDVRIYSRLLSEQEITDLFNADPTSAASELDTAFKLYPNPTKGQFFIDYEGSSVPEVTLFDVLGREVSAKISLQSNRILVETDYRGKVFARIWQDESTCLKRIQIQ